MTARRRGEVITFYSYKGGVGRSMALANVAALLAQRGRRVLAIDFDLEAPGLHRYFLDGERSPQRFEPIAPRNGVVELFHGLRERLNQEFPDDETYCSDPATTEQVLATSVQTLVASGDYTYRVQIADPNADPSLRPSPVTVDLVPAGRFDSSYAERAHDFDWRSFYREFAEVFPVFARIMADQYDYVLIDSRTGITDVGSICTAQLPDILVLVFAPNRQALDGVLEVGHEAAQIHRQQFGSPLLLYPLVSRVEDAEDTLKRHWIERAITGFEALYREEPRSAPFGEIDEMPSALKEYFARVRVPYRTYYAYGEQIAAERERVTETGGLAAALDLFVQALDREKPIVERPEADQHARSKPARAEGLILISIGEESIRSQVEQSLDALSLRDVEIVLDYVSARFVDPEPPQWREQAAAIRDQVRRWVDDPRYDRFHLFYRGPVVSAPLLGALIAPSRELNIYYYDNGRYSFAYTLNRRFLKGSA
jgi:CobQ/CobB/MinD/ParA nucleotide binding domain